MPSRDTHRKIAFIAANDGMLAFTRTPIGYAVSTKSSIHAMLADATPMPATGDIESMPMMNTACAIIRRYHGAGISLESLMHITSSHFGAQCLSISAAIR